MRHTHTQHRALLYGLSSIYIDVSYFHFRWANIQFVYILLLRSIHDITKTTQEEKKHCPFVCHTFSIPPNTGRHLKNLIPQVHTVSLYIRTYPSATRHAMHILYNGRLSKYKQNKKSQCWIILFIFLRIRKYIFFVRFFSARPIPGKAACLVNMG